MNTPIIAQRTELHESLWLESNAAAIAAIKPTWADDELTWVDVTDEDDEEDVDLIEFRRDVGAVTIEQGFNIDDGVYTPSGPAQIRIAGGMDDHNVFSIEAAIEIAPDAFHAACLVRGHSLQGEASMSDLFRIAESFSITPSEVFALDESDKTPTEIIVSKIRRAADLIEQVAALEAEIAGGDEDAFADAIRPHLVRIGVALGDIPADEVAVASGLNR